MARALDEQLARLSRGDLARDSLERFGALILVRDEDEAVRLSNLFAPEHLHVSTADPERLLPAADRTPARSSSATTRRWPWATTRPGPSHVLPTGGTARWASGLSANDFLKRSSLISVTREGLAQTGPRRSAGSPTSRACGPPLQRRRPPLRALASRIEVDMSDSRQRITNHPHDPDRRAASSRERADYARGGCITARSSGGG